jgi:hypothetical protein
MRPTTQDLRDGRAGEGELLQTSGGVCIRYDIIRYISMSYIYIIFFTQTHRFFIILYTITKMNSIDIRGKIK